MKGFIRISHLKILGSHEGAVRVSFFTHKWNGLKGTHYMTHEVAPDLIKATEGQLRNSGCTEVQIIDQRKEE